MDPYLIGSISDYHTLAYAILIFMHHIMPIEIARCPGNFCADKTVASDLGGPGGLWLERHEVRLPVILCTASPHCRASGLSILSVSGLGYKVR